MAALHFRGPDLMNIILWQLWIAECMAPTAFETVIQLRKSRTDDHRFAFLPFAEWMKVSTSKV